MESVKHEIEIGKDYKEVIDLLVEIVERAVKKEEPLAIGAAILPLLPEALEGIANVPESVKGEMLSEALAYAVDRLGDALGK